MALILKTLLYKEPISITHTLNNMEVVSIYNKFKMH